MEICLFFFLYEWLAPIPRATHFFLPSSYCISMSKSNFKIWQFFQYDIFLCRIATFLVNMSYFSSAYDIKTCWIDKEFKHSTYFSTNMTYNCLFHLLTVVCQKISQTDFLKIEVKRVLDNPVVKCSVAAC